MMMNSENSGHDENPGIVADIESINSVIELQLMQWPEAKANFDALQSVKRKKFKYGDFEFFAQWNPGRIKSTGADINPDTIKKRRCFLCAGNRPTKQFTFPILQGWELLVNPYPILPVHFTIASGSHIPQNHIPYDMGVIAAYAPHLMFFYNGAKAGASAPDHLHFQAVLKDEVPLVRLVEKLHPVSSDNDIFHSEKSGAKLPFHWISSIIKPTAEGMKVFLSMLSICGKDSNGISDPALVNAYIWTDSAGLLRMVVIPRKAHRPTCYYADDDSSMLVSPGALDMAGIIILPREEDFNRFKVKDAVKIYSDVAFS